MDLVQYIRAHSQPLVPLESAEKPVLTVFQGIKAVIFDIYGTIMISAAGDINQVGSEKAMAMALSQVGGSGPDPAASHKRYWDLIRRDQEKQVAEFPEVEILEVWETLLAEIGANPEMAPYACVVYECAINPVWPMPGLDACLERIRSSGRILGVVSNAQFYTPLIFPALTGKTLQEHGFCEQAMIFSHLFREGKPSRHLYRILLSRLAEKNISPSEVLYIGNDRLKDVWPAGLEGIRTVLFAGDQRSLRWHENDQRLTGVRPDAVITHLNQLCALLS